MMLHVIWRRSVLSVSRTLSLVVQCGSFCGRWSKAVSQSRHPVAYVCMSVGHFKIGKNESTDKQRCHMLSMMIACWEVCWDLLEKLVKHLRSYPLTTWTRSEEISGSWIIAWIIIGQAWSNCEHVWLPVCHNVSHVYSILFGQFFLQMQHTGHGGPLVVSMAWLKEDELRIRRIRFRSQADILGDRRDGAFGGGFTSYICELFSNFFPKLRNDAKGCKRPKGKLLGSIGSDVKVWTFLSSWRIAILHEGRLKCCGEGPQRVCPRLHVDCTWKFPYTHPYPAFDICWNILNNSVIRSRTVHCIVYGLGSPQFLKRAYDCGVGPQGFH